MRFITGGDLRAMRTVSGLTTMQMAAAAGVKTRKTYENWEKNLGTPNVNQFIMMSLHCGLKPSEFIANFEENEDLAWKDYSQKMARLGPKMTDKKRWLLERALLERTGTNSRNNKEKTTEHTTGNRAKQANKSSREDAEN